MFEKFIDYLRFEKRFSEHTLTAYQNDLKQFAEFLDFKSETEAYEIKSSTIRSWIVQMIDSGLKNKSVNRKIASLRTYYRWLRKEGINSTSPMQKIQGPKNEKRLPVFAKESDLASEKLDGVFTSTFEGIRDELMFELFYQTGIRLNELIELKEKDFNHNQIKVLGKRNKERIIPISQTLSNKFQSYLNLKHKQIGETSHLFVLPNGNKLYSVLVYRKINYYLGLTTSLDKKSPHILRHTFATHMLNNGSGLETLKDLLGHANLSATQIYTHNSFAKLNAIYSQAHPRGHNK
jgi:integrase/recombinase XerC